MGLNAYGTEFTCRIGDRGLQGQVRMQVTRETPPCLAAAWGGYGRDGSMKNGIPTLLVAEDNDNDFLVLEQALRKANFETDLRRVRDGAEVIQYLAGENDFAERQAHP